MERKGEHGKEAPKPPQQDAPKTDEELVKAKYTVALKTHKLPPYADLVDEFEIDTIEPDAKHIIREVAKKMFERTDSFRKILEAILQGDTSVLAMQEAEFFTEQEHERIAALVRKLMRLDRALLVAELDNKDDAYAAYVNETWETWPAIKKEIAPIIVKMRDGWSKQSGAKKSHHYLG